MSLTFMKNKYIDLSISFCYLVCLFLQNICLYFAQIFSNLSGRNPSSITLKRNYDYKTASGWQNILQWYDVNGRTGYLQENIGNGEIKLCLQNERGDILINGNSIAWIANNINNLKSSRNWNVILAAQADGEHEIQYYLAQKHC